MTREDLQDAREQYIADGAFALGREHGLHMAIEALKNHDDCPAWVMRVLQDMLRPRGIGAHCSICGQLIEDLEDTNTKSNGTR